MSKRDYMPKAGDLVVSRDHNVPVFKVLSVSDSGMTELQPFHIGKQQLFGQVTKAPRSRLRPFKEDASQAAARIVKEATERE